MKLPEGKTPATKFKQARVLRHPLHPPELNTCIPVTYASQKPSQQKLYVVLRSDGYFSRSSHQTLTRQVLTLIIFSHCTFSRANSSHTVFFGVTSILQTGDSVQDRTPSFHATFKEEGTMDQRRNYRKFIIIMLAWSHVSIKTFLFLFQTSLCFIPKILSSTAPKPQIGLCDFQQVRFRVYFGIFVMFIENRWKALLHL